MCQMCVESFMVSLITLSVMGKQSNEISAFHHIVYLSCCMVVRPGRYQALNLHNVNTVLNNCLGGYFQAVGESTQLHILSSSFINHCHCT